MKSCEYTEETKNYPERAMPSKKKESRYPQFSLWSPEAINAVFGSEPLVAGSTIEVPMRLRVKSATSDAERGTTNVEVEITAVGEPEAYEDDGEDEDEA